ncbi:Plasmodium variant antigen protein Cir/Yir/Bir, putative [Plasmodium chabaudi adami]|uniref:Plasmodium variant antigen protein Cir/Yir/Bir, putative n=1 Tax=Plasmodium chabaudi adami TaxID=5826 RepID=A0A1C6WPF5_PLACE|nr:Plasmodium variant antigen protein Cir/Yir/Bir, putative [Plasmodium chabaudi adami]
MLKDLCDAINGVDQLIKVKVEGEGIIFEYDTILDAHCPTNKGGKTRQNGQDGQCIGYSETVVSAFIQLLETFKNNGDEKNLKSNKLAQYAILLLSYKINQHPSVNSGISDIYSLLKKNRYWNNNYHNYIEQIENLMNMDTKDTSKFYNILKLLCDIYTVFDEDDRNCATCLEKAKEFVKNFEELNNDSSITGNKSYSQILYDLSTDYNSFKSNCDGKCSNCNDIPPLPNIKAAQNLGRDNSEGFVEISESTSSNSSIASKLIPGLLIFSIPVFLGISYKTIFKRKTKKNKEENESLYMIRRVVIIPGIVIMIDMC